jgi:hypothetical protein
LLLTSTAIAVSCLEWLYKYRIYAPGGWLYWEYVRRCRRIYASSPLIGRLADIFFAYPAVLGLIAVRLILAVWLMADILHGSAPPALIMALCGMGLSPEFLPWLLRDGFMGRPGGTYGEPIPAALVREELLNVKTNPPSPVAPKLTAGVRKKGANVACRGY